MFDSVLEFIHSHKGAMAVVLVFLAAGCTATGHEHLALSITSLGTLLKVGFLPDGPNPKVKDGID